MVWETQRELLSVSFGMRSHTNDPSAISGTSGHFFIERWARHTAPEAANDNPLPTELPATGTE